MKEHLSHMKKTLKRTGAIGLAAATIVTGLSFGPAAVAAAPSPTSSPVDGSQVQFVGQGADGTIYGQASPTAWNVRTYQTLADAQSNSMVFTTTRVGDYFYAEAVDGDANRCLFKNQSSSTPYVALGGRCGSDATLFSIDGNSRVVNKVTGTPMSAPVRIGSYSFFGLSNSSPLSFQGIESKSYAPSYNEADDTVTLTITGGENDADVFVEDMSGGNGTTGRTNDDGDATITLSPLLSAGETVRLKYGESGTWETISTGRLPAIGDLQVVRGDDGRVTVSGKASGMAGANVYVGPDRLSPNAVQIEKAAADNTFSFVLNDAAAALSTGYIYSYIQGVRTEIAINGFSGKVDSVDIPNRTAVISGTAVPGSFVLIDTAIPDQVQAGTDGRWSHTVTDLTLGSNPIPLSQYENGEKTGETTLDVVLDVSPVRGSVSFPADLEQDAVLSGTAHPGSTVVIRDVDGDEIARTEARLGSGAWSTPIGAPDAGGDYDVRVHQEIDGEANGEIVVTVAYGAGVAITAPVEGMAHDGGPVTLRGTGEVGAQVTVREEGRSTVLGSAQVLANGQWTIRTTDVDDRKHVLEASQTGKGNNTTTSTVTLNPENGEQPPVIVAPTVETPEAGSTVTTSRPVFSGHGQDGATVTIGYGPNSIIGTGTVVDGEWTITPTRGLSLGTSNLVVTQTVGDDVQQITHTINRVAAELPLSVTSHVNDQFYEAGVTTFRGTAPIGSTVTAKNQWGTPMGAANAADGTWAFNRNLGPTTAGYLITFTATPPVGTPQVVTLKLNYENVVAFQITSPTNNSTYTEGTATFRGTAAPNAAIAATNQWGTPMGSTTASLQGDWAFDRYLGPTSAGYDITFVATKGTDVQRQTIHLDYRETNVPVAVTSIADGDTYRPGMNVLKGTGTPGATVRAVNATNNWNVPMGQAEVDSEGNWALPERNWGPANDYAIKVTQTNPDKSTTETTVNVKAPRFAPLVLTSPAVGDTYENGVAATFTGTATPFATVTVSSATSSTVYREVQADAQGNWSFSRAWGPSHNYTLNITQKALDGQTGDPISGFAWHPSGN
ncbi:hypothetical protein EDF21_1449 [Frigoribacterium sp. PhB118]|nr:hypothetical protein EDF21_1449 [Frigoribacterium sp. PhB118]